MEKTTIFTLGKYTSVVVMLLTGIITVITTFETTLNGLDYGKVIIAFGVFLVAFRNYLKDTYGVF